MFDGGKYDLVFVKNVDIVVLAHRAHYNIRGLQVIPRFAFICRLQNNGHISTYFADSTERSFESGQGPIYADPAPTLIPIY